MKQPESTRLARTGQQGKGRVACTFRLTAPCVGSRRASAAPGGYRPSGPQKPGEAIADAFVAKLSIGPRLPLGTPPQWLRNSGVESPQQKGDSPWTRAHWTDWVTRSPSCRLTSTPRLPASSISSGSSTPEEAGTPAFAPAPPG